MERGLRDTARRRQGRAHVGGHRRRRRRRADDPSGGGGAGRRHARSGRIVRHLRAAAVSSTTPSSCSPPTTARCRARHFYGNRATELDYGYYNWYYGDLENDDLPAAAGRPASAGRDRQRRRHATATRCCVCGSRTTAGRRCAEAAAMMDRMPTRDRGVGPSRRSLRPGLQGAAGRSDVPDGERAWFARKAQELVDTRPRAYGPDVIATLPTTRRTRSPATTVASSAGPSRSRSSSPEAGSVARPDTRAGPLGRHHADDPAGACGIRATHPDGRHGLRAARGTLTRSPVRGRRGPDGRPTAAVAAAAPGPWLR